MGKIYDTVEIEIVRSMAAAFARAKDIAEEIGKLRGYEISRSSIIGHAHRNKIPLLAVASRHPRGGHSSQHKAAKVNPADIDIEKLFDGIGTVKFLDAAPDACRWPKQQQTICGERIADYNPLRTPRIWYCPKHLFASVQHG